MTIAPQEELALSRNRMLKFWVLRDDRGAVPQLSSGSGIDRRQILVESDADSSRNRGCTRRRVHIPNTCVDQAATFRRTVTGAA
jgi:hypothetical protein